MHSADNHSDSRYTGLTLVIKMEVEADQIFQAVLIFAWVVYAWESYLSSRQVYMLQSNQVTEKLFFHLVHLNSYDHNCNL